MVEFFSTYRDLGGSPMMAPTYTEHEESVLQILALIFATVSIISTTITSYWFLTMRRSFRHHLLMMLIQSDMLKALWYMIYAIAALTPGSVDSESAFCQISGFFTAAGIELSDFAVLMVAVHSALYIFKPPTSIGEGGLYPYRYIAYVLWIGLPLLMASLAFLNPMGAYKSSGTNCHLPVRPFWYRLALSWVPRYLIFIIILSTDISIYFYVRYKFGDFSRSVNTSTQPSGRANSTERRQARILSGRGNRGSNLSPTPALAYHGLIPETRQASRISWTEPGRSSLNEPPQLKAKISSSFPFFKWTQKSFPRQSLQSTIYSNLSTSVPVTSALVETRRATLETTSTISAHRAPLMPVSSALPSSQTSWTTFVARFNSRSPSKVSVLSFLRLTHRDTSISSDDLVPHPQLEIVDSEGRNLNEMSLQETRSKIRRQLQFLFVYPLAYMAMWTLPLVAYSLEYDDYYAANPPFVLSAVNTVIVVSQSAVDCWIFNIKEKPWRKTVKNKISFLQGVAYLKRLVPRWNRSSFGGGGGGGGKSKGIMDEEARFAYQRRDEERAARVSEIESVDMNERRERSWWDEIGDIPETMNPLPESSVIDSFDG